MIYDYKCEVCEKEVDFSLSVSEHEELVTILKQVEANSVNGVFISKLKDSLAKINEPTRKELLSHARKALRFTVEESELWEVATKEISKEFSRSKRDDSGSPIPSTRLQNMLIQRARIAKKADLRWFCSV